MFTSTRKTRVEWGDCDPAGIIFFARYFDMFDVSTTVLIERALGMKKIEYLKAYSFSDHPLVETRARFLLPTRFGDEVAIETAVVGCGRSSFKIEHHLTHDGALAVEGFETRVWVVRDPDDPTRIKSQPIPPPIVARLTQSMIRKSGHRFSEKTMLHKIEK
jgi:4-hydroxybenzoyl-CoA thioesterase